MEQRTERQIAATRVLRRTARIWSIATLGLVLLLLIGEGVYPSGMAEWIEFLLFPTGICVGMIIAWWKEGVGGIVTVASLLVFYGFHLATAGTLPKGLAWVVFAAPGFLFLLSWYWSRAADSRDQQTPHSS